MRGDRFAGALAVVVRHLPFGLARIVPPSLLGFAIINGFTFGVDLLLLTVLHGELRLPLPLAVTAAYATAFALSFLLNRAFNFRSHGRLGRQIPVYIALVVVNYLVCILGVTSGLVAVGVGYRVARIIGGLCEAACMYSGMRWLVFRDTRR